jgi:hypothetical protein
MAPVHQCILRSSAHIIRSLPLQCPLMMTLTWHARESFHHVHLSIRRYTWCSSLLNILDKGQLSTRRQNYWRRTFRSKTRVNAMNLKKPVVQRRNCVKSLTPLNSSTYIAKKSYEYIEWEKTFIRKPEVTLCQRRHGKNTMNASYARSPSAAYQA